VTPRVLFVDQSGELGGAEFCLLDLMRGRQEENRDRVVLFQDGPFASLLEQESFDIHVLALDERAADIRRESRILEQLSVARSVRVQAQALRRLAADFDIVYANTAKALVIAALAVRGSHQRLVYHLHDMITAAHFSRFNRWLLVTLANRYADRVIANSASTAKAFIQAGGNAAMLEVIPNGFRVAPFDVAVARRQLVRTAIRATLGLDDATPMVALFGRFATWKGQHVAVEAIRQVPDVHLLLVGEALFGEQEYLATVRQLVDSLGITERVHFLGFRDDVIELMQAADIVLHASTAPEPFGRVIVEAMLAERPVIATRGGGAAEIVTDHETGLLCQPGDADGLTLCIRKLIANPILADKLVQQAARAARERFRLEGCVSQTNDLIAAVASGESLAPVSAHC
jgi:glycosyltransferase involved in cell wall biosynthesis